MSDSDKVIMTTNPEFEFTTWHNPTAHTMSVEVMAAPGRFMKYEIKPDQKQRIPKTYDNAIRTKDKAGVVVGGLAPLLVPDWDDKGTMHAGIADAAHMGDVERDHVARTGKTPKPHELEEAAKMYAANIKLEQQLASQGNRLAELESRQKTSPKASPG